MTFHWMTTKFLKLSTNLSLNEPELEVIFFNEDEM